MKETESEFHEYLMQLPALERAAAITHRIYMLTACRTGWPTRTPERWADLDNSARQYNIESIQTWLQETELFDRFQGAIAEARASRGGKP